MAYKQSSLVLSMTLAETFLLLLFLIWIGDVARHPGGQAPTDPTALTIENAKLKKDNAALTTELEGLHSDVRKLQLIVDAFRKSLGIHDPVTDPAQVGVAIEAVRRGAPKCAPNNVFAHVTIEDGSVTLLVVADDSVIRLVEQKTGERMPAGSLTTTAEMDAVLRSVTAYAQGGQCRFDYTLTYRTKADYFDGRERFERVFYPAGLVPEGRAAK